MANYVRGYTIAFERETDEAVLDFDIVTFFKKIEETMKGKSRNVIRKINGKVIRVHAYEWDSYGIEYLVVPFGKLKEKNKPYGMDPTTQALEDIKQDMYDVNNFAYHSKYKIALVTTNQQGPSVEDIENYLNSFLPKDEGYRIRIRPIKRSNGIEEVRNATQAQSVSFNLDLGRPLNDFFKNEIIEDNGIAPALKSLMETSKNNLESKSFTVTLGLGRKRKETLNIEYLLGLLESINLDSSCVKEIFVNYRNNTSEKIEKAKLKESNVILTMYFDIKDNRIGTEYLKANLEGKLMEDRKKYYRQIENYFQRKVDFREEYKFVEEWNEENNTTKRYKE